VAVDNPNTNGVRGLCLDPADLAVSKLAAGREKDLDFVHVLLRESIVTLDVLDQRIRDVPGLDDAERLRLQESVRRLAPP
jgi:hypothetical protein